MEGDREADKRCDFGVGSGYGYKEDVVPVVSDVSAYINTLHLK